MSEQPPKPKFRVIEGGKAENASSKKSSERVTPELKNLWTHLTDSFGSTYFDGIDPHDLVGAAFTVSSWSSQELFNYLSQSDIFDNTIILKAILDEIGARILSDPNADTHK